MKAARVPEFWKRLFSASVGVLVFLLFVSCGSPKARDENARPGVEISVHQWFDPDSPTKPSTRQLLKLIEEDPEIKPEKWGGIRLPGGWGRSSLMMAFAGRTAPDLMYTWFHSIHQDIEHRFLYPLNEWIGEDADGNGQVDDHEAKWEPWKKVPPLWRRVATRNGKIYGLPEPELLYMGLLYRKDMVRAARRPGDGDRFHPDKPPGTWDELFYWCQRLTFPKKEIPGAKLKRGQRGMFLPVYPWLWLPWMQAAGGSVLIQTKKSPTTGKEYDFPMSATSFIVPETGEDLSAVPSKWRANFSSQAGLDAAAFYHKMRWAPWIIDKKTGEPVNLTEEIVRRFDEEGVKRQTITVGDHEVTFTGDEVIRGVIRSAGGGDESRDLELFQRGEVAIVQNGSRDMENLVENLGLPPEEIGMFPIPAKDENHKPVFQIYRHYAAITDQVADRPKHERDKVWKCLTAITSEETSDYAIRRRAMLGGAMWCRPDDLKRLGLEEYLDEVPKAMRTYYDMVDRGEIRLVTEPFAGSWEGSGPILRNEVVSRILATDGLTFDYEKALKEVDRQANSGVMFERPKEVLDRHRPLARVLFGIGSMVMLVCAFLIIREKYRPKIGTSGAVRAKFLPWIMLAPALLTIGLWSYYPLVRGLVMAFQKYRIVGESEFVGLDNFISVAMDPNTWLAIRKTLKFVVLTMFFGFLTPIALALLLSEVPRGKIFFRMLFFLPKLTSGLVIALLWKIMYNPTENGAINRVLMFFGMAKQDWLGNEFWAMFCCILPGVWAGAGIGSLIYIAALKSFPPDYYEAAAIDGAGFFGRVRHIALPQLLPLIVINFVGTFIAAFQNMGQIFLLTFGGPGKETEVVGLRIWKLAYNELRFSTATTLAWFLGVGLIAFTYCQIRFLRRVEFKRAEEN